MKRACLLLIPIFLIGCHIEDNPSTSSSNDPLISNPSRRIEVKINSVEYLRKMEDRAAPKGREYAVLDVTIKNLTSSPLDMSPFYFALVTDKGQRVRCDILSTISLPDSLSYFYLSPGESARGRLVFLIDEGSKASELVYGYWEFVEERFSVDGGDEE
jgi:hypothetical protein